MRAAPADLPSSDSRVHLASPGRSPSKIVDLAEDVSGEPGAVSSANLYLETEDVSLVALVQRFSKCAQSNGAASLRCLC